VVVPEVLLLLMQVVVRDRADMPDAVRPVIMGRGHLPASFARHALVQHIRPIRPIPPSAALAASKVASDQGHLHWIRLASARRRLWGSARP
jgi:hypothetical protein